MIEIDREPLSNIVTPASFLEGFVRPALPEVQAVFEKEPQKEEIVGIGRNRFVTKLLDIVTRGASYVKDSVNLLKRHFKGRGGGGRCPGCRSGTEGNHWGSKCRRSDISRLKQKPRLISSISIGKLTSIPSGFR